MAAKDYFLTACLSLKNFNVKSIWNYVFES